MPLGFYIIMAAQFFSALADNALLIASIALLRDMQAPQEYEPLLKLFFTVSYVALAAFVGAYADSMPKWRVMLIANTIKIGGCAMMLLGAHPLFAYAVVGLGAAAYSPAKYGILTEYLPHRQLVVANGWIEGLTVGAIILGTVMGGALIRPDVGEALMRLSLPGIDTTFAMSLLVIGLLYVLGVNGQILMHYAAFLGIAWFDYLDLMRDGIEHHGPVRAGVYAMTGGGASFTEEEDSR